jgi:hypothetical protein
MGTSSSSSGPGHGVSLDPPWLDDLILNSQEPSTDGDGDAVDDDNGGEPTDTPEQEGVNPDVAQPTAPVARFGAARRHLGDFVNTGERSSLRKAMSHYSKKGMGGSRALSSRMRASSSAGASLFNLLQSARDGTAPLVRDWVQDLSNRDLSANEIADEIISKVLPDGGSIEEESCRNAMADALSELISENPDINLLHLDDNSIWSVIEKYIAGQAFYRIQLDIGQVFESSEHSPRDMIQKMNQMREYLSSEISAQIQRLRRDNQSPSRDQMNTIIMEAVRLTFAIFEGET